MTPYVAPLHDTPFETKPLRGAPRRESEIIAGRIASARRWRRHRSVLRLRAALFGRRRHPDARADGADRAGIGPAPRARTA